MSGGKQCNGSLEFKSSDDEIFLTADGAVRETLRGVLDCHGR